MPNRSHYYQQVGTQEETIGAASRAAVNPQSNGVDSKDLACDILFQNIGSNDCQICQDNSDTKGVLLEVGKSIRYVDAEAADAAHYVYSASGTDVQITYYVKR